MATKGKYNTTTSGCSVSLSWRMQVYAMPENIAEQMPMSIKVREIRCQNLYQGHPAKEMPKYSHCQSAFFPLEK